MKKLVNKKCKHLALDGVETAKYSDLLDYCIRKVPAESLNGDMILRVVSIHDSLKKMEFEDKDYEVMKAFVMKATWGQPTAVMDIDALREIKVFIDDVCSMD